MFAIQPKYRLHNQDVITDADIMTMKELRTENYKLKVENESLRE